jgi:hypothetical protein
MTILIAIKFLAAYIECDKDFTSHFNFLRFFNIDSFS